MTINLTVSNKNAETVKYKMYVNINKCDCVQ